MLTLFSALVAVLRALVMPRANLALENAALRQQLATCMEGRSRYRIRPADRAFWIVLRRMWSNWTGSLLFVKPATVIGWHKMGFLALWRRKSNPGRPDGRGLVAGHRSDRAKPSCSWPQSR